MYLVELRYNCRCPSRFIALANVHCLTRLEDVLTLQAKRATPGLVDGHTDRLEDDTSKTS
jgi:hypothetical protein